MHQVELQQSRPRVPTSLPLHPGRPQGYGFLWQSLQLSLLRGDSASLEIPATQEEESSVFRKLTVEQN